MGSTFSRAASKDSEQYARSDSGELQSSDCETMEDVTLTDNSKPDDNNGEEFFESSDDLNHITEQVNDLDEFKKDLAIKREKRREIIAKHTAEKENLKTSLKLEKKAKQDVMAENVRLRELLRQHDIDVSEETSSTDTYNFLEGSIQEMRQELEEIKDNNQRLRRDLAESNLSLQSANSDMANISFQNVECMKQITALKEVVAVSKTMINIREGQLNELKAKLGQIEESLAEREASLLSHSLRQEYERQLTNIRSLRALYEERARLAEATRVSLVGELADQKLLYQAEANKCKELTTKVEELEEKVNKMVEAIDNKDDQISITREETRGLKAEMSTVNKLFSQMLLGYKSGQDLDKLVLRLEENHGLLAHMVEHEKSSETSSALPKLLLELVSQVDEADEKCKATDKEEVGSSSDETNNTLNTTPKEIVENLPKVWKVLMELLSHQSANDLNLAEKPSTCYKSVEMPSGPVLVPSVSQTYIRLKDLIVEKLSLIKEVNKMKQLNGHLETRLEEQERRLCLVTSELSKTWHVVGRLRRHHHQLHTHEKILRYELQQKRKMLNELKEELEYCREKWDKAKEKNTETEREWRKLRAEFSSRKAKPNSPTLNNSGESGYSDERQTEDDSSESNDESESTNERPIQSKKQVGKLSDFIPGSNSDLHLIAEREDPISDLLDIAELPLDSHEIEEDVSVIVEGAVSPHNETENTSACESCSSDLLANSDTVPIVVSDTGGDAVLQAEELSPVDNEQNHCLVEASSFETEGVLSPEENNRLSSIAESDRYVQETNTNGGNALESNVTIDKVLSTADVTINPAEILESIRQQNERLAKRDERLKNLENGCDGVHDTALHSLNVSLELNKRLDKIHDQRQKSNKRNPDLADGAGSSTSHNASLDAVDGSSNGSEEIGSNSASEQSTSTIDHEARFAARDERFKRLEEQAKSLVNQVNDTKNKRIKIKYKLEELHNIYGSDSTNSRNGSPSGEEDDEDNSE